MKKPNKSLGVVLKALITLLILAILYYFLLPPIHLRSVLFWQFVLYAIVIVTVLNLFTSLKDLFFSLGQKNVSGPGSVTERLKAFFKSLTGPLKYSILAIAYS